MVDGLLQIAELELSPLNPVGSMGPFGGGVRVGCRITSAPIQERCRATSGHQVS